MTDLRDFLNKYVNVNLRRVIVSNARKKDGISKIQVRPIQMKNGIFYQVTRTLGPKEIHENYEKEALVSYLCCQMTEKLGASLKEIDIKASVTRHFEDIGTTFLSTM